MSTPLLLALDCGTQSVRALLFDGAGNLVAKAQAALDGYRSPQPEWHEHDGEALWLATAETCRKLWELPGAARERAQHACVVAAAPAPVRCDSSQKVPRDARRSAGDQVTSSNKRNCRTAA